MVIALLSRDSFLLVGFSRPALNEHKTCLQSHTRGTVSSTVLQEKCKQLYKGAGIHGCQRSDVKDFDSRVRKLLWCKGCTAQQEQTAVKY